MGFIFNHTEGDHAVSLPEGDNVANLAIGSASAHSHLVATQTTPFTPHAFSESVGFSKEDSLITNKEKSS